MSFHKIGVFTKRNTLKPNEITVMCIQVICTYRCTCRRWIIPLSCSVCSRMTAFNTDLPSQPLAHWIKLAGRRVWPVEPFDTTTFQLWFFSQGYLWYCIYHALLRFDAIKKSVISVRLEVDAFKKNFKQSGFTLNILFRVKFSSLIWKVKIQNVFCYKRSLRAFQRQNVPEKP